MRNPFRKSVNNEIGLWAIWATRHKTGRYNFHYVQVRPFSVQLKREMFLDCSAFVAWCYRQAGAPDPYRLGYAGFGNTEDLIRKGTRIRVQDVRPGDVGVMNMNRPATEQHAVIVVAKGLDPTVVSMGQEGDPVMIKASADPRPVAWFRFDTTLRWAPTPFPIES